MNRDKKLVFRHTSFARFTGIDDESAKKNITNTQNKLGYVVASFKFHNIEIDPFTKAREVVFVRAYAGKKCARELQSEVDRIKFEDGVIIGDSLNLPGRSVKIPKMSKNEAV